MGYPIPSILASYYSLYTLQNILSLFILVEYVPRNSTRLLAAQILSSQFLVVPTPTTSTSPITTIIEGNSEKF